MLVEGSSMRSVSRVLGVSINTVSKLLIDAGKACAEYHDKTIRNVNARSIQCDEIWSFVFAKARNANTATGVIDTAGDVWTWTGLDRETKLIVSWLVGGRDSSYALEFMDDLQVATVSPSSVDDGRPQGIPRRGRRGFRWTSGLCPVGEAIRASPRRSPRADDIPPLSVWESARFRCRESRTWTRPAHHT